MEMTLRWYGTGFDSVTLQQIRQVPGVHGVITTLYDSVPGDAWELAAIQKIKKEVQDAGLKIGCAVPKPVSTCKYTCPRLGCLTSLSLSFSVCRMGRILSPDAGQCLSPYQL